MYIEFQLDARNGTTKREEQNEKSGQKAEGIRGSRFGSAACSDGFREVSQRNERERETRGWNKARVLNATDVHLLVACLPAWCSYPWTADARVDADFLSFSRARPRCVCTRRPRGGVSEKRVGGGRRVGKQVAPKPQPWAVAVKYCGCFKNRSFLSPPPLSPQSSLVGNAAIFPVETRSLPPQNLPRPKDAPRDGLPAKGSWIPGFGSVS